MESYFSVKRHILSVRDYAERLSTNFYLENQSDQFGNDRSLSIEGCNIEFVDNDRNAQSEFHSHLSDDSRQYVSTTHAYIISMWKELVKGNKLNRNCTICESNDDFCKQYRCDVLLYFFFTFV